MNLFQTSDFKLYSYVYMGFISEIFFKKKIGKAV